MPHFRIFHAVCGMHAFNYDHKPVAGEVIAVKHATLLNGKRPKTGHAAVCGSCGHKLKTTDLRPDPTGLLTYDMEDTEDMEKLYE